MAKTGTYSLIAKTTSPGSGTTSIDFTNIPGTYTDLIIVANCGISTQDYLNIRVGNGSVDTGANYSNTVIEGDGASVVSQRGTSRTAYWSSWTSTTLINAIDTNVIIHFMDYANTTTYKTFLSRTNATPRGLNATVGLWRSTSAINAITLIPNTSDGRYFVSGSTFKLYGIQAGNN